MMREILGVGEEPRIQRHWFHDEFFDLFVWQAAGGEISCRSFATALIRASARWYGTTAAVDSSTTATPAQS